MIGELAAKTDIPLHLVDAHVNAIMVIHKSRLQDSEDKTAQALCVELDARVNEMLARVAK
jgi:hypothetical protein